MPAIYWIPLPGMHGPARVEHLHAAFSRWFDADGEHHENVKPYRIAPMSQQDGRWGVEIAVLSEEAFHALESKIAEPSTVRLGGVETPVATPVVMQGESWDDLAHWRGETGWRVDFLTPFTSRTGSRSSPFPSVPVVLRAATEAWAAFSGGPAASIPVAAQAQLWVSHVELSTTTFSINGHRHPGALGSVTYRAADAEVARIASPLFGLAHYCGMGSFRGKGMGVVSVTPLHTTR